MATRNTLLIVMILLGLTLAGCSGDDTVDQGPGAETLTLSEDCRDSPMNEKEQCCSQECSSYCSENGYTMAKVETFTTNCGCWCEP